MTDDRPEQTEGEPRCCPQCGVPTEPSRAGHASLCLRCTLLELAERETREPRCADCVGCLWEVVFPARPCREHPAIEDSHFTPPTRKAQP